MAPAKSLDQMVSLTIASLMDVQTLHSNVFTPKALKQTISIVKQRSLQEGVGFLTKALPRLGKSLDKALAAVEPLDAQKIGFQPITGSKLPKFLGELFQLVLSHSGEVLPDADVKSIITLRQLLYCFYKYELPYEPEVEQNVISKFERTESDVAAVSDRLSAFAENLDDNNDWRAYMAFEPSWCVPIIRRARKLLFQLFTGFDRRDIFPRHGPGAVADKLLPWDKYAWKNLPRRLTTEFPIDEYFVSGLNEVVDSYKDWSLISEDESSARVCLVPKDSRGPRLISCEPAGFQWIQQGLRSVIYRLVESHPLTCEEVRFTDQLPNQTVALLGSREGRYATLDLNEASDRVTVGLVRLLFPGQVLPALMASRSLGTTLPSGQQISLKKFAPMGSALCFPVLALTVWSLLKAGLERCDATKDRDPFVYVYGDDVIVETANAEHAMNILEAFGLKVNRDKSCTSGLFRESCGMDAYKGVCVTPVKLKTVWSNRRCPNTYVAWIEYANTLYARGFRNCYELIVDWLCSIYGDIPVKAYGFSIPSRNALDEGQAIVPTLCAETEACRPLRHRNSPRFQRREYLVWEVMPRPVTRTLTGYKMLLRYFAEACASQYEYRSQLLSRQAEPAREPCGGFPLELGPGFSVGKYTLRGRNMLRRRWR